MKKINSLKKILKDNPLINKRYPNLIGTFEELIKENKYLKVEKIQKKKLEGIIGHEMRGPLGRIIQLSEFYKRREITKKETFKIFDRIYNETLPLLGLSELFFLWGSSKQELKKNRSYLDLGEISKNHILPYEKEIKKESIGFELKQNYFEGLPLLIYANNGVINTLISTLIGNSISYATPNSDIQMCLEKNDEKLKILLENQHIDKKLRNVHGAGNGWGFTYVKDIINTLGGNIQQYKKSKVTKNYNYYEKFGYKEKNKKSENQNVFGIKIEIPTIELSE